MILRPAIRRFAEAMETVLRENDKKGGWKDCDDTYLLGRLNEEISELKEEIGCLAMPAEFYTGPYRQQFVIQKEAVDVANFCMMIFDNHAQKEGFT